MSAVFRNDVHVFVSYCARPETGSSNRLVVPFHLPKLAVADAFVIARKKDYGFQREHLGTGKAVYALDRDSQPS